MVEETLMGHRAGAPMTKLAGQFLQTVTLAPRWSPNVEHVNDMPLHAIAEGAHG
jgi:hypothetical protein